MAKKKPKARAKRPARRKTAAVISVEYEAFLRDLKQRIRDAQVRAALAVNRELVALYWHIGKSIVDRQRAQAWGTAVIDRLGNDLQVAFPGITGFSRPNIYRMRAFYLAYADSEPIVSQPARQLDPSQAIVSQPARQLDPSQPPEPMASLPWFHNVLLVEKLKKPVERLWYGHKAVEHGWSRTILEHQIESALYHRQGKALTNFERTLLPPQSELAQQLLKDPYNFDFLTLADDAHEQALERGLLEHLRDFLLELGVGFAFVGQQFPLEIDGEDFFIDLLFYHLRLRCFVVIDLKTAAFRPEFAGKMNFYLSAVDDRLRHADDKPSIGLILCKTRSKIIAEYTLRDTRKPIGVAAYRITAALPKQLQGSLPTIEDLEAEFRDSQTPKT